MTPASSAADDDPEARTRQRIRAVLDRDDAPPGDRIATLLRRGAERFGVALGLLVRVDAAGDTYEVDESSADPAEWTEGLTGDLLSTYCRMVVSEEAPLVLETVSMQGGEEAAAHRATLLSTYIGATVRRDGAPYGTVCFVDRRARDAAFDNADRAVLAALADGIGRLVEQRDAAAARAGADANAMGDVTASLDITEPEEEGRRRDERTLAYRALAENFPDGVVGVYDSDLRYTLAAGTLAGETLPTAEETVGSRVGDLFPKDTVRDLEPLYRAAVEDGTAGSVETTFNGRAWRVWAVPLRNHDDEIFAGLSFAQDITEQKEREAALREQRNLLEQTQRLAGAWRADLDTGAVQWSEAVYRIHEVEPGTEMDLDAALDFFPDAARETLEAAVEEALETDTSYDLEVPLVTATGERRWVRTVGAPVVGGTAIAGALQDVTERHEAEQGLREREARLRDLSNSIPGVVFQFYVRPDGTYGNHFVSEHAETVLGISADPSDFFERCLERVPASYRDAFQQSVDAAVENEAPWEFETPFDAPDGERRWLLGRSVPRRQGDELVYNGVLIDITDRKESERRLDAVFNHTYQFTGLMEPDGTLIEANDTALRFAGVDAADVLGRPLWETYWFQAETVDRDRLRGAVQRAAAGEFVRYELTVQGRDECRTIDFSLRPVENEEGDVVLVVPEGRDITEQKEAERQLRESERRFRRVFENAAIGIVIGDDEGRIQRANPAFRAMLGYEEGALRGRHFSDITHPDDVEPDADRFEELVEGHRTRYQIEKRYVRKGGEVFWGRLTASLLDLDDGTQHVALIEDIDEQKRQEEALRRAKTEAEEAARLKTVMLANMSHEIRTPLTSMIGFSGILQGRLEGHPAKLARLIYKSGQRLEETMEAVLELSQLEAGSYAIDRASVDLRRLVHHVVDEFEPQAQTHGVTVAVQAADAPVEAYADRTAVRRVIVNLLDNAIKFTPEGGRVTVRLRPEGDEWVVLAVEDTGVGIAADALPTVFKAFKQESEGLTREYEGVGLGLAIVHELVQALGGRIDVDSEKGEGTHVVVHLPRAKEAEA
jgi:PAS domain S-box-containing protein